MQVQLINDVPAIINNMVGKVCDFQVKVTSYNIKHRVEDYGVVKVTECNITPSTSNVDTVDTDEPSTYARRTI